MKTLINQLQDLILEALQSAFSDYTFSKEELLVSETKPEFEGDYTLVLFPFLKKLRTSPQALGEAIGNEIIQNHSDKVASFEIVSGFLNFTLTQDALRKQFIELTQQESFDYLKLPSEERSKIMVEYSSPNTNKPLHFGHLRNIFLGWSVSEILKANGHEVVKSNLINDRGIHICKSMIAWQELGEGKTPETEAMKGDHFVGEYYVKFNDLYKEEIAELVKGGMDEKEAEKEAPIMKKAQEMLVA
ncbi:MAG TPA: arginine--tRNA ligase, partial [Chitinophagaceae bacterium]|nr:arginine--tRNA ligase [Chitinophagaceae bacterium]